MLDTLITNKTRIKLLLRFFLNSNAKSYLRGLEGEFDESTNAIRLELNRFKKSGLLVSDKEQNRKVYKANTRHPLYPEIHNLIRKYIGFDQLVEKVVRKLGGIRRAYITGNLAKGLDSRTIELVLVGNKLDEAYLSRLVARAEKIIHRKVLWIILPDSQEATYIREFPDALLIWKANER
jgi:hypothetical protein